MPKAPACPQGSDLAGWSLSQGTGGQGRRASALSLATTLGAGQGKAASCPQLGAPHRVTAACEIGIQGTATPANPQTIRLLGGRGS